MNTLLSILYLVMAPPESPPVWLWIIMLGLLILSGFLIANSQGVFNPKKLNKE